MRENLNKYLVRGLALVLAVVMVVGVSSQFRGGSLKATDADEAHEEVQSVAAETVSAEVVVDLTEAVEAEEAAEAPEAEEAEEAAEAPEAEEAEEAPEAEEAEEAEEAAEAEEAEEAPEAEETEAEEAEPAEASEEPEEDEEAAEEEEAEPEVVHLSVQIMLVNLDGTEKLSYGSHVRLQSVVADAPEGITLNYSWSYSLDGVHWTSLGAHEDHYDVTIDRDNCRYLWKVDVTF